MGPTRKYGVRANCEFYTEIEAASPEEALEIAWQMDMDTWDKAWSDFEIDEDCFPNGS